MITLRPLHIADLPLLWRWLNQYPGCNFNDYSPIDFQAFSAHTNRRLGTELIRVAEVNHMPCGVMAAASPEPDIWEMHGICFDKAVHGKGVAKQAFLQFLCLLWEDERKRKVCANYFADNIAIRRFLSSFNAVDEGYRVGHTTRGGLPIDMYEVALWRKQ